MSKEETAAILKSFLSAADGALKLEKYDSAEHFYKEALQFSSRHLGPAAAETALASFCLSMFYLERGDLGEATLYANQALDTFTTVFGSDHPATGMALHQLAEVCVAQNLSSIAESIRKRAAQVLEDSLDGMSKKSRYLHLKECVSSDNLPSMSRQSKWLKSSIIETN